MVIKRIQVEEGFLSGLDLDLSAGLNVLIGPRGSGKTSIIELIRFCLNVKAHTEDTEAKARDYAAFVLGPGEVTVTLLDGDQAVIVSRTLEEEEPRASESFNMPIILSQNEIESVGMFPASRLRLIDDFIKGRDELENRTQYLTAQIQSQTAEIRDLSKEIESLDERLRERPAIEAQLADVTTKEKSLAKTSAQTRDLQLKVQTHSEQLTAGSLASAVLSRSTVSVGQWKQRLEQLVLSQPSIENWPDSTGIIDPLAPLRNSYEKVTDLLNQAARELAHILDEMEKLSSRSRDTRVGLEARARDLRKQIEQLQLGAGAITRQASEIREKLAHIKATETLRNARLATLRGLHSSRAKFLDELEQLRQKRFESRESVAQKLNKMLRPRLQVQLLRSAQYGDYISTLSNCLRGSGLKYNELSALIAESMSPRELVEAAEEGRFQESRAYHRDIR